MKNRNILSAVAVIMAISGCAKENVSTPQSSDNTCFSATLESASPETRTTITDDPEAGYRVTWVKDDTISVNGKKYYAESSGASTKFKVYDQPATETEEYHAYYPSSLVDTDGTTTTLPDVQKYGGDGVISNVPSYAYSTDNTLEFKSLCGVLAVEVEKGDFQKIKSVRVSSDQAMCGEFELADDGGIPYAKLKNKSKKKSTSIVSDQVITLGDDPSVFYITIPVGEYTNLRIEPSSDGIIFPQMMSTKTDQKITISRNKVYPISFSLNTIQRRLTGTTNVQL